MFTYKKNTFLGLCILLWWHNYAQCETFHPSNVSELIADITEANSNNDDDIIDLGHKTFLLLNSNNNDNSEGNNGLPSILSDNSHSLTIKNGTLKRSLEANDFRFLRVDTGATLILCKVTLKNGLGDSGGAILNEGTLSIENSIFENNESLSDGGAISNSTGTIVKINNTTFDCNSARTNGGAIVNVSFQSNIANIGVISNSTFFNNTAGNGGAISNINASIINFIQNSTFNKNRAVGGTNIVGEGGAIENAHSTINNLNNNTIAENTAINQGGGIANFGVDALITNFISNILALNNAPTGPDLYNTGTITNSSFNLIGTNPKLGPLKDNGGPTKTMALLTDSPAIDEGDNPNSLLFDQRGHGFKRTVRQTDIGAFEVQHKKHKKKERRDEDCDDDDHDEGHHFDNDGFDFPFFPGGAFFPILPPPPPPPPPPPIGPITVAEPILDAVVPPIYNIYEAPKINGEIEGKSKAQKSAKPKSKPEETSRGCQNAGKPDPILGLAFLFALATLIRKLRVLD